MRIKIEALENISLATAFFFTFAGYYIVLAIISNIIGTEFSRALTIPLRVLILASMIIPFLLHPTIRAQRALIFFVFFSFAYLARIIIEMHGPDNYHISVHEFLLYFLSFVLIPLILLSQFRFSAEQYDLIFYSIFIGCIILAFFVIFFYRELIGQVSRISQVEQSGNYISPLALSYTSALGIGIGTMYIITNSVTKKKRIIIIFGILMCLPMFFLGASRGSIVALAVPFLFYFIFSQGVRRRIFLIVSLVLLTILFTVAQQYLGTGVFDRFFSIQYDIERGASSVVRLEIWKNTWQQFLSSPIFGNSLESDWLGYHPHNLILEVLVTTGLLGFVPFVAFLIIVLRKSARLIQTRPDYSWIIVIFTQAFTAHLFSGAIYSAAWLALGAAMIIGFSKTASNSRTKQLPAKAGGFE